MDQLGRMSVEDFRQAGKIPLVVVLDNIRSMHNVGSVFRSSDAFLVEAIYLCGYTPKPPHRDIHKTALGATETVSWSHFERIEDALDMLKRDGYNIVAIEQTTRSTPLHMHQWDGGKTAIVLGNEVEGVQEAALTFCSQAIEIPQFGTKHSLNVSVAAGILLWHFAGSLLQKS